jgi:hypothetical protein
MDTVCFIIPTFPPHYNHIKNIFFEQKEKILFDIYLVLSFKSDINTLPKSDKYKLIILEEFFDKDFITGCIEKNIIITFKKYFALEQLYKSYKYLITSDDEIKFQNTKKIFEKCDELFNRKIVLGSVVNNSSHFSKMVKDINENSSMFFKTDFEISKLREKNKDFQFYFWFSDLCVYESNIVQNFLKYIDFNNYISFKNQINFFVFDYISYIYYCMIYYDWNGINIKDYEIQRNWSLEGCNLETYKEVCEKIQIKPLVIHHCWFEECKQTEHVVLTLHIDRGKEHIVSQLSFNE